jgi:hypothetical protein
MDVDVNVPDELDLSDIRFNGPKPGEELLSEVEIPTRKPAINQELVQQVSPNEYNASISPIILSLLRLWTWAFHVVVPKLPSETRKAQARKRSLTGS